MKLNCTIFSLNKNKQVTNTFQNALHFKYPYLRKPLGIGPMFTSYF